MVAVNIANPNLRTRQNLNDSVRRYIGEPSSVTNKIWSDVEVDSAVILALQQLASTLRIVDTFEDTFTPANTTTVRGTFEYALPLWVERVVRVQRKLIAKGAAGDASNSIVSPWTDIAFEHFHSGTTNTLMLMKNYATNIAFRVIFERAMPRVDDGTGTGTVDPVLTVAESVDNSQDAFDIDLVTAGALVPLSLPLFLLCEDEVMRAESILAPTGGGTSRLGNVTRGLFETAAASHSDATAFTMLLPFAGESDEIRVVMKAAWILYHQKISDGNESRASIWITKIGQLDDEIRDMDRSETHRREPSRIPGLRRRRSGRTVL